MFNSTLKNIEDRFEHHLRSVDELVSFDKLILDTCIGHIDMLNEKLKRGPAQITNQAFLAENTLSAIKNVRQHNSLRHHYISMFNSCVVLQVSYFTSTIHDIFKHTAQCLQHTGQRNDLDEETLKSKNDINFQNMKSTIRTFKKYLDIEIAQTQVMNTVILAQCSRHALVHSLGKADAKFIQQINQARPRDIKQRIDLDEKLQFTEQELLYIKTAMKMFAANLCVTIKNRYQII